MNEYWTRICRKKVQYVLYMFLISYIYTLLTCCLVTIIKEMLVTSQKLYFTLILPTPKVISLCNQYRARPDCTSVQSDQALLLLADQFRVFILTSLKMIMECSKNRRWIISFKEFGMVRVKHWWFSPCRLYL